MSSIALLLLTINVSLWFYSYLVNEKFEKNSTFLQVQIFFAVIGSLSFWFSQLPTDSFWGTILAIHAVSCVLKMNRPDKPKR